MADVFVSLSGDATKLEREYQKIIDKSKQLDGAVKETKKSHDDAFGDRAAGQISSLIGRYAGMAAAIGSVASMMKAVREEADRLGQEQRTGGPALGKLAQLAETPEEMARLVAEAKKTFAAGGAKNIEQAAAMQFALESAQAGAMREGFARLQATGVVANAQLMAESASQLQRSFGEAKTGDLARIASTAFGGGKLGLGEAEQLLTGAAAAGPYAARLGLSPEEAMAAVSTISGTLGAQGAGTAAEQLFKQIETQGVLKKGVLKRADTLQGYLSQIQALEKKGVPMFDILGDRAEATVAYSLLTNLEGQRLLPQNLANIQQAQQENWFQKKLELATTIPENLGAMTAQTAENRGRLAGTREGLIENLADALEEDLVTKKRAQYGRFGAAAAIGERWGINIDRLMGQEQFLRRWGAEGTPETQQAILDVLKSIDTNVKQSSVFRSRATINVQPE